jgi:hypothetical protein
MKLAELQSEFHHWLVASSDALETCLDALAKPGLTIYQNNYRTQLVNCLQVSFPQLRTWLGDEAFLEAAIAHIDRRPPHAWTLDAYGADFGDTLQAMFPHNPDIHELAWIEWALSESFVAADADLLPNDELWKVDWNTARLRLAPSLRHHAATTNVMAIWSALQDGAELPESAMLEAPGGLIVWRRDFTSRLQAIDAVGYAALLALQEDHHFDHLCEVMVEHLGEEAGVAKAGALLADWLTAGIVVGVE